MWELLSTKSQVTIAVVAGAAMLGLIQFVHALATGQASSQWHWVSLGVTILIAIVAAVGTSIWFSAARLFPILQTAIFPDLNGTWRGHLRSTWIDDATGEQAQPIQVSFTIRQTLFTTSVSLSTPTSSSKSVRVFLEADRANKRYRILHFYANEPSAAARRQLTPHLGMASLDCDWDVDQDRLTGRYFTDRKTTGDIELRRIGGLARPPAA